MAETRERIVQSAAALFLQQGYAGTGLKAIVDASEATTGSLYHFFPGGKAELAAETLRVAGRAYEELVMAIFDAAPDLLSGVRDAFEGAAEVMRVTDYVDACPVATVALEVASSDEPLRLVTAQVFSGWLAAAAARIEAAGVAPERAHELATTYVAALEGGFLLSRVAKDATALEVLGRAMVELTETALRASDATAKAG